MFELPTGLNEFEATVGIGFGLATFFIVLSALVIIFMRWINEEGM